MINTTLPTDSNERKEYSIARGCLAYFPAAIAGVARHSFKAGAKHTQGELVHKRWLSGDHDDCIERHLMDIRDMLAAVERRPDGAHELSAILSEANALAWRALALSQELHERFGGAPLAPAARLGGPDPVAPAPRVPDQPASAFTPKKYERIHKAGCYMDPDHFGNCAIELPSPTV